MTFGGADGGIVAELQSRHGHSAQPESQQVLAVLQAVLDVISAQGMSATPTTMFAALMSALERPDAQESPVTALAMCTVLSTTLSRVPNGVLRSKFVGSVQLLSAVVEKHREQAPACKGALQCLGQVLSAVEPGSWPPATASFQLLLSFVTDARPKIRKRATSSVTDVLAAVQSCPANLAAASEAILALCKRVLPGPAAAQRAAAAASNKQRQAAEAAIVSAVADLLHVLGALKTWAPLMAGSSLPHLIDMLVKLYALHQPLVNRHTSEVLAAVASSSSSHLGTEQLAQLLGMLIDGEASQLLSGPSSASSAGGGDQVSAMGRLLEGGLLRLADSEAPADAAAAARLLPRVVHLMVPLLSAEQDGVRYNASGALQSLLNNCATRTVVVAMQQQPQQGGMGPLQSLVAAVAAALGARYQEAWGLALPVASKLFEVLAAGGAAAAATPLLTALGQICAGLSDAAEQREASVMAAMEVDGAAAAATAAAAGSSSYAAAAEAALGSALKHLDPEVVLQVLPLDLQQGLSGAGEARTWLLPALRRHVSGTQMRYWATHLMPLAKEMGQGAAAASQQGNKGLAGACHALEVQLWSCLQSFANWPTDAAQVYPDIVRELASAFHVREDLRSIISSALVKLCKQSRSVALAALDPDADSTPSHLTLSQLNLSSRATQQGSAAAAAAMVPEETLTAIRALGLVSAAAAAVPRHEGTAEDGEMGGVQDGDASDDDFEEYGASDGGSSGGRRQQQLRRQRRQQQQQEEEEGPDGASHAPEGFTAVVALGQLQALRTFSSQWMTLLCRVYIDVEPELRGPVGDALAAYASISDKQLLGNLYRVTLQKYQKVASDATSEGPVENPLLEGGGTPEERQASFLELALCLAAGLPDSALDPLFVLCQQHLLGGSSLLQKRSYRVLAYLAGSRPDWLKSHLQQMLELMLLASAVALSPAKRYRLKCLRPIILLLDSTPCPPLPGLVDAATGQEKVPGGAALAAADDDSDEEDGVSKAEGRWRTVAQTLVGEVVLATKEVNKKTRTSAYQLLVDIAHELDDARPLTVDGAAAPDSDDEMADAAGQAGELSGGLIDFVNAVMAGLVGSSPHMQSAAVLGLSRLVFEFAGQLEGVVGRLLPAVLLLLRSHSREVIKAVLGFLKVCAMRMPVDMLLQWLPQMMEGMLIWSDDSKNKFRLKIRVIIERLVRRCGVEPVAAACPQDDYRLMTHIRKQQSRKERRRAGSEVGSQADEAEFDRRSRRSSAARTARASEWGHTAIFSEEGGDQDTKTMAGRSSRGGRSVAGASTVGGRGRQQQQQQRGSRVQLAADSSDPQDLLEPSTARQMVKLAAGTAGAAAAGRGDGQPEFPRGDDGRFVIREEDDDYNKKKRKRRGDDMGFGEDDDSDMEDMRGFSGLDAAVRGVANAKSVRFAPTIAASLGNRSLGQRSTGSKLGGKPGSSSGGKQHTGDRFKPKAAGASGDVKGKAAVDPYAYWQFDRKMLNRRRGKQAAAAKGLGGIVGGAQAGALKGAKAKRAAAAANAKRAKR